VRTSNQAIISLVKDISLTANETFGERCSAVYIMGSLARGGFSEVASDVDIGIVLGGDLKESDRFDIDHVQSTSVARHPVVINAVSIFWGSTDSINGAVDGGRYPPFDRLDLIDHALLLSGVDRRQELLTPTQEELAIDSAAFALDYLGSDESVNEFLNCEHISNQGAVHVTKTILFPARFIYLERTGEIAGNDVSHQYYVDNFSGPDAELVRHAYQWRLNSLPQDLGAVTGLLNEGLIELYHRFIDIYAERMNSYGQHALELRLREWKQKLTK
jgi:hypothetical protein